MSKKSRKSPEHYLLTVCLSSNLHMHAYLMCDGNRRWIEGTLNKMLDLAEKEGFRPLPLVLSTSLSTEADIVREILSASSAEAKRHLDTATDFHLTIFTMPADSPDDARLMELH